MLILIDVHNSWKAAFSFEKGLNHQNHSFSGSLYPVKKSLPVKFLIPPPPSIPLSIVIWKTLKVDITTGISCVALAHFDQK